MGLWVVPLLPGLSLLLSNLMRWDEMTSEVISSLKFLDSLDHPESY